MKKIFAILIFLLGVALIVASMLLIPLNLVQEVLIMDIVVLSIIWSLLSYDILVPLATDKAQDEAPEVGHWGVVWAGQLWYIIPALLINKSSLFDLFNSPLNCIFPPKAKNFNSSNSHLKKKAISR